MFEPLDQRRADRSLLATHLKRRRWSPSPLAQRNHAPLAARIRKQRQEEPGRTLPEESFLELLEQCLEATEANRVSEGAMEGGVHAYDSHTGRLARPDQAEEQPAA